jgi:uncharacterized protein YjlB
MPASPDFSAAEAVCYRFTDDGSIPNNPRLPLVVYPGALQASSDLAASCKRQLEQNGWDGIWVDGIFGYHHFHSTAHEVLVVIEGMASVQFGGRAGEILELSARDVVVLPAGTGHARQSQSPQLSVIGAYPRGQRWDLCTESAVEHDRLVQNIERVPLPKSDPIFGESGPLLTYWG